MSFTAVQTALDSHLQTLTGLPTLQLENTRNVGRTGVAFSRATLLPAGTTQLTVGASGKDQLSGLYQIDLFYPQDTGTAAANAMADAVIAHFPRVLMLSSGDVMVHIQTASRQAGGRIEMFYQVPVVVRWSAIV